MWSGGGSSGWKKRWSEEQRKRTWMRMPPMRWLIRRVMLVTAMSGLLLAMYGVFNKGRARAARRGSFQRPIQQQGGENLAEGDVWGSGRSGGSRNASHSVPSLALARPKLRSRSSKGEGDAASRREGGNHAESRGGDGSGPGGRDVGIESGVHDKVGDDEGGEAREGRGGEDQVAKVEEKRKGEGRLNADESSGTKRGKHAGRESDKDDESNENGDDDDDDDGEVEVKVEDDQRDRGRSGGGGEVEGGTAAAGQVIAGDFAEGVGWHVAKHERKKREAGGKYVVEAGDTLMSIALKHQIPWTALLQVNHQVDDPNLIFLGQELAIPTLDDALRIALLNSSSPQDGCNYVANPSFELAADAYGAAVKISATDNNKGGGHAFAWKGMEGAVAGPHYERDAGHAHSGGSSLRMQCLGACAENAGGWRGVFQTMGLYHAMSLRLTMWVSGEALTPGTGAYLDVAYAAPGGGASDGWGERERADLFLKDLTIVIPSGSYGWWPLTIEIPPPPEWAGDRVAVAATLHVMMRGASGVLWVDDVSLAPPPLPHPSSAPSWMGGGTWVGRGAGGKVKKFHRRATHPAHDGAVTLVTQLSPERLSALSRQFEVWGSFMSAAVLVTHPQDELPEIERWWLSQPGASDKVDIHIVEWEGLEATEYPVNALRNVAVSSSRTRVIMLLDVDLIPFTLGQVALSSAAKRLAQPTPDGAQHRVFVVPTFEQVPMAGSDGVHVIESLVGVAKSRWNSSDGGGGGSEKRVIRGMMERGIVRQVHGEKYPPAHGPTDYERWKSNGREYAVTYESEYEPYILCRRDIPAFDERFVGYGGDKTSHAYELSRSGYVFVVLPGAFAVHAPHAKAKWSNAQNWTRSWMNWFSFVDETGIRYSPAPPPAPPGCPSHATQHAESLGAHESPGA